MSRTLQLDTFNKLADIWAYPAAYLPTVLNPLILSNSDLRKYAVGEYLAKRNNKSDVIALQEVQDTDMDFIKDVLSNFEGIMAQNSPEYWSNWINPEIGWHPNGPALFINKNIFSDIHFEDLPISNKGNHAVKATATHIVSGQKFRFWSIHLDSDLASNRRKELESVISQTPANSEYIDIIMGDFNYNASLNPIWNILNNNNFILPLQQLGELKPTHPFLIPKYYLNPKWSTISHIATRGENITAISGKAVTRGIWSIKDEASRINANMAITGSDHFPLKLRINF
jgi:endonuclease/exonuclease/phosphatase family metal-dependent hydrolase